MASTTTSGAGAPHGDLLRIEAAAVAFGGPPALDGVDLAVAEHEIVSVLGPSGSGKSTLLRAVAGLQPLDSGRILLDGADQAGVPVHRRAVGLMFQDHALFPQRDVAGNVAFGPRMHRRPAGETAETVDRLLGLVGLAGAQRRPVGTLSGGEQQRVALARALAPEPRLLMLDEPLGQLDRGLRERLVVELRGLFTRLGTTVLAVTHDQGEAFALADRVVVMEDGRIAQQGTPQDVWERPASEFVARFLGFRNLVRGVVAGGAAETPWGRVPVRGAADGPALLLVRPSGVRLSGTDGPVGRDRASGTVGTSGMSGTNGAVGAVGANGAGLAALVTGRTFRGDLVTLTLEPERGPELEASCRLRDAPPPGTAVSVGFDPDEVVVLPR